MVCDSGPAIISGTRAGLVEQVPAFWKISLKKLCFDNESVVKKMNQTDMRERAQKEGWQWWEAAFGYNGLIVVLISKSFVKITSANSARHIVSPQGILAIILSLFLTPQYLDSYYSPGLEMYIFRSVHVLQLLQGTFEALPPSKLCLLHTLALCMPTSQESTML